MQDAIESGVNYSLDEYASNIVFHVFQACDQASIEHPVIITESGRAVVAYHSVLVVNVLDWIGFDRFEISERPVDNRISGNAVSKSKSLP